MADPVEEKDEEVVSIVVDKEGAIQLYSKKTKKFKPKFAILSGGGLYYKTKPKDPELSEPIIIKGATIESTDEHKKNKFAIKITSGTTENCISLDTEAERTDWLAALKANTDKEVGKGDKAKSKKTQSAAMRIKKAAGSSVATSSAGKGLIKEFLGKDGIKLLDLIKSVITIHEGKKKASEIENNIIRVAVKVILLWQNKDITPKEIASTVPKVKAVWSDIIDFCEMSFAYDPPKIKGSGEELVGCFKNLLKDFVTENTLTTMQETISYITKKELLDILFANDEQEATKKELMRILRSAWIAAFKDDRR